MRAHSKKMQEQVSIVNGRSLVYQGCLPLNFTYCSHLCAKLRAEERNHADLKRKEKDKQRADQKHRDELQSRRSSLEMTSFEDIDVRPDARSCPFLACFV